MTIEKEMHAKNTLTKKMSCHMTIPEAAFAGKSDSDRSAGIG